MEVLLAPHDKEGLGFLSESWPLENLKGPDPVESLDLEGVKSALEEVSLEMGSGSLTYDWDGVAINSMEVKDLDGNVYDPERSLMGVEKSGKHSLTQQRLSNLPGGLKKVYSLIPLRFTVPDLKDNVSREAVAILLSLYARTLTSGQKESFDKILPAGGVNWSTSSPIGYS